MVEEQSFLFDFSKVDTFYEQWNMSFKIADMTTSNNFQLVFCSDAPDNIEDCLTSGGGIDVNVVDIAPSSPSGQAVIPISLKWENNSVSVRSDATWNIGDNPIPLKAIFIRSATNGYVMAYCIHMSEFTVTNKIIFDAGTVLWRFIDD